MTRFALIPSQNQANSRRRAFTLVELLIVIAVIGILIAILLPAVGAIRETARQSTCRSNLKQLALAIKVYEQKHGNYPMAASEGVTPGSTVPDWGLIAFILPFMEGESIHEKLDYSLHWDDPFNEPNTTTDLGVVVCPSAPGGRPAVSDYAAATRIDRDAFKDLEDLGFIKKGRGGETISGSLNPNWLGILQWKPQYRIGSAGVKDGETNTMLLVEDGGRPELWKDHEAFDCSGFACPNGEEWATEKAYFVIDQRIGPRLMNVTNHNEIYSFHRDGCVFAFAGGNVAFYTEEVDPELFVSLFTREAGELAFTE